MRVEEEAGNGGLGEDGAREDCLPDLMEADLHVPLPTSSLPEDINDRGERKKLRLVLWKDGKTLSEQNDKVSIATASSEPPQSVAGATEDWKKLKLVLWKDGARLTG